MGTSVKKQRPVNLELNTISFPATAIASILHRITGVIMFFAMGILMWLLALTLSSEDNFNMVSDWTNSFILKFVFWGTLTALAYHLLGGLRHLVMDLGFWEELESGKQSAVITLIITGVCSIAAGVWLW
ncbi:succinate dehydrogenase [Catenovulum maritimum]|uniref:Succinate dehydrogenase cytochrome b556 subunit n=1 Tax=Catenovulum maritimum TaxID=1513271 RepID=A0A0J8GX78_9ALTE|nr:succinate dehydrogenase cytochrome b556 subunit [Catenovulum maritimum]KMT65323.1 succinate dehydrogenase [Catenovulum maritimum]